MGSTKFRLLWIAAMLLVLVAVIGLAVCLMRPPRTQSLPLPDGSELKLLKVTHGTNHVCRYQTGWQEMVYPLLPKTLRPNLSPREMRFTTVEDTMMVWFM